MKKPWHVQTVGRVLEELSSAERGLSGDEAARRLATYGPNELPDPPIPGYLSIFLGQFRSPLIYVLIVAAAAIFLVGSGTDAAIILAVLLLNSAIGAFQEGRAQSTLRALKRFSEASAAALRDGLEVIVPNREVVPGDVISLREGAKVPADGRVFLSRALLVDEASLTGESEPVEKLPEALADPALPISDRACMVYKGTNVVGGNGLAVVVATGPTTEIGQVATQIAATDTEVPLHAAVRRLSRAIVVAVLALSVAIFFAGLAAGYTAAAMFSTVVSLAVSVIPEGLPVVLTLVLATGVWRMSRRNVLVKKLQAVEALGQATVVAVDKTGTVTRNELSVQRVWIGGEAFEVAGVGYDPKGEIRAGGATVSPANHGELLFAGKVASFCANARPTYFPEEERWRVSGDPTEAALFVFGQKAGFVKEDLEAESPLVESLPFDYARRYHATVHAVDGRRFLTVVGAPETVLPLCTRAREGGKVVPISAARHAAALAAIDEMSSAGLRVLAFATRAATPSPLAPDSVGGLVFGGFYGMKDGLRAEVRGAVEAAQRAGIRVVMLTGDHPLTARAIAAEAGIFRAPSDRVLTGAELESLDDEALRVALEHVSVFARVTPAHKLRIVGAYRARGEVVAMTGDGVNDAPSLVAADLGIGMGRVGTEVAKEASDIVLLDDDFRSIVAAVEEGRGIYETIRKVTLYLFSTNAAEALVIVGALAVGLPLPLLAAQIIWLNFVTDGFSALALAVDPKGSRLLDSPPARGRRGIVDLRGAARIAFLALPMTVGTLALFSWYLGAEPEKALTVSLTTLAAFQWWNAWNCRSARNSVFARGPANRYLAGATVLVIALQALAVYAPFMQRILGTVALSPLDWLAALAVAATVLAAEELRKLAVRRLWPAAGR